MERISEYYGIQGHLPFVDVDIDDDNRLYLDPHAIRLATVPHPFTETALRCLDTFFSEVTTSIITGTPSSKQRGERLLQRFSEPWETRLGMAAHGFYGHGGSADIGSLIWNALNEDVEALVRILILNQIEDIPVFVAGVDRDITSDLTTRIIYGPLADFTAQMIKQYPQFTAGDHQVMEFQKQVWNPVARDWTEEPVSLPVANGKPLLLVPDHWVRATLLMSATRFYETSVLSFAQLEQAVLGANGKLIKTPKHRLKKQSGLERGRETNIRLTKRAFETKQDLLAAFKDLVAQRFQLPDTDDTTTAA